MTMKDDIPKKPETQRAQIEMLWEAAYNHLPHKISILGVKVNLIMAFGGLSLALLAVVIALVR